jgi:hypothetical protein
MLLLSKSYQNPGGGGWRAWGVGGWGGGENDWPGTPMGKRTRLGFLEFPNLLSSEEIELTGVYILVKVKRFRLQKSRGSVFSEGAFNFQNLTGCKPRLIDICKQISFYF